MRLELPMSPTPNNEPATPPRAGCLSFGVRPTNRPSNPLFTENLAMRMFAVTAALVLAATVVWAQERTPSPAGAEVYIISPTDGAKVSSPFVVQFGLKGMGIAPAGMKFDNTGHHHLLIDTDAPADAGAPLPASDKVMHFGKDRRRPR